MKSIASVIVFFLFIGSDFKENEWTILLDKNLSQWETYLSYSLKNGYNGEIPKNEKGEAIQPIGYNKEGGSVFSVIEEKGEPVLKINGKVYGCVFTKR